MSEDNNQDIKENIEDKEINYANSLIKELTKAEKNTRGKIASKFSKVTNSMDNEQLIKVVEYLSKAIEENNESDNLMEDLLDKVLENIEGNI